jgi:hypothetical protein
VTAWLPMRVPGLGARGFAVPFHVALASRRGAFQHSHAWVSRCGAGGAWPSRRSAGASRHRPAGVRDGTPSMPAVCLPRLSWLIRRTANRRAYQDFTSHFCSFRAVLTSARCVAWYIRFWRRQTCRCTFCHGLSCQATFRDWPCVLAPSSDSWLDLSGYRPDLSLSRAFPLAFASSGLRLSSGPV